MSTPIRNGDRSAFSHPRALKIPGLHDKPFRVGMASLEDLAKDTTHAPAAFFRAAQRAFIRADNFCFIARLIGRRLGFFCVGAAFFGADLRFHNAHRFFMASAIRFRAARLIVRLRGAGGAACALGGRPRRGVDGAVNPSKAAIA